jgi:hypothetical protein
MVRAGVRRTARAAARSARLTGPGRPLTLRCEGSAMSLRRTAGKPVDLPRFAGCGARRVVRARGRSRTPGGARHVVSEATTESVVVSDLVRTADARPRQADRLAVAGRGRFRTDRDRARAIRMVRRKWPASPSRIDATGAPGSNAQSAPVRARRTSRTDRSTASTCRSTGARSSRVARPSGCRRVGSEGHRRRRALTSR